MPFTQDIPNESTQSDPMLDWYNRLIQKLWEDAKDPVNVYVGGK
jgi:hypothetical protein